MDDDPKMYCRHCWNPVEQIKYREDGAQLFGDIANKWKHSGGAVSMKCSTNPITDDDVIPESDLP